MKCYPTARTLVAYRERDSTPARELKELLDNSLGMDRGNASRVHIQFDAQTRLLSVLDNGAGMEQISFLFTIGDGVIGTRRDIGKYGQGGSGALLWLADTVEVWSMRDGRVARTRQDFTDVVDRRQDVPDVDDRWERATTNTVPDTLAKFTSGTLIRLSLRPKRRIYPGNLQKMIAQVYAPAIRHGRHIQWIDSDGVVDIKPWEPGKLLQTDEQVIRIGEPGLLVKVKAGIGQQVSRDDTGISICFRHREIFKTREPLGNYDGGKLFGWADLSDEWHDYLTNDHNAINDDLLHEQLMDGIASVVRPLIARLQEESDTRFAANLTLLVAMEAGKVVSGLFPDTSTWRKTRNPRKNRSHELPKAPQGIPVKLIESNEAELNGRYMRIVIYPGSHVAARYDKKSDLIQQARSQRPINKLLLKSIINDELSSALVRQDLVVKSGLFSPEDWDFLVTQRDRAELASFVKPRLFKNLRDKTDSVEAARGA